MSKHVNILILGARYGLLPGIRLQSGHQNVSVVCFPQEREALVNAGAVLQFQRQGGGLGRTLSVSAVFGPSRHGRLGLVEPTDVEPANFDLLILAMSEPCYAADGIRQLMSKAAAAEVPMISLMNMLPPPFLSRLKCIDVSRLQSSYNSWSVWQDINPQLVTAASPDAQAVILDPNAPHQLTVTLASNFKVAPFHDPRHQALLQQLADVDNTIKVNGARLAGRLQAHPWLQVPLVKWPMLVAGNCRCLRSTGNAVSIAQAVHENLTETAQIYDQVQELIISLGCAPEILVPFKHYATAARSLTRPSSFARAVHSSSPHIERVDKMIQAAGAQHGYSIDALDRVVTFVDDLLPSSC